MKLKKIIMSLVLNLCRPFLIFTKVDPKKITFVSLESDKLENDFLLIDQALKQYPEYKVNYILVKFEKNLKGYFKYFFVCIKQFFVINTSRLVIIDYNNFAIAHYKRPEVKVLQLWHASGALKKFGNDVDRDYQIRNYDYVIANSDYFIEPFSHAFNINADQVCVSGIPKTDELFNLDIRTSNKEQMLNKYPQLSGKKVILYAPTFRGRMGTEFDLPVLDLEKLADKLGDEYIIMYKLHPLLNNRLQLHHERLINVNDENLYQLFSVCDYLISDYSAVIIDFLVFDKPIILYTPDLEQYKKEVGLYVDYQQFNTLICKDENQIITMIKNNYFDMDTLQRFKNLMFKYQDGKSLNRVMQLIDHIMKKSLS